MTKLALGWSLSAEYQVLPSVQRMVSGVAVVGRFVFSAKLVEDDRQHPGDKDAAHPFARVRNVGPADDADCEGTDVISLIERDARGQRIFAPSFRQVVARMLRLRENHGGEVRQFAEITAAVKKRG